MIGHCNYYLQCNNRIEVAYIFLKLFFLRKTAQKWTILAAEDLDSLFPAHPSTLLLLRSGERFKVYIKHSGRGNVAMDIVARNMFC